LIVHRPVEYSSLYTQRNFAPRSPRPPLARKQNDRKKQNNPKTTLERGEREGEERGKRGGRRGEGEGKERGRRGGEGKERRRGEGEGKERGRRGKERGRKRGNTIRNPPDVNTAVIYLYPARTYGPPPVLLRSSGEFAHPALDLAHAGLGAGHTVEKQIHFLALLAMNVALVVQVLDEAFDTDEGVGMVSPVFSCVFHKLLDDVAVLRVRVPNVLASRPLGGFQEGLDQTRLCYLSTSAGSSDHRKTKLTLQNISWQPQHSMVPR
jgi:hypothetical protein